MPEFSVLVGDVRDRLRDLPNESVQCVVTSPPYWGLRDYGAEGQLGLEPTPEAYVATMVEVFREVRRVLRNDGTVWLNLGDSYTGAANSGGANQNDGGPAVRLNGMPLKRGKPKDLVGIPWRVAFALQADGWWLRSDIIWAKPNPMPESVTDRPTKAHEYLFLLTKSQRYYYNAAAVRTPAVTTRPELLTFGERPDVGHTGHIPDRRRAKNRTVRPGVDTKGGGQGSGVMTYPETTANLRSVWSVATEGFPGAHFATFPKKLVEPCVLAGSRPGDTVLDPFAGSGTTGLVALRHLRSFIGIELNPEYAEMARGRIRDDAPLFNRNQEAGGGS